MDIDQQPKPSFDLAKFVRTPVQVCESGQAYVFGREWGPANPRLKCKAQGWVYHLYEVPKGGFPVYNGKPFFGGRRFEASEEEMIRWQKG